MTAIPIPPPLPPPIEMNTLLKPHLTTKQQLFAPVWMQEIQNNKIFNKQKSINEDLDEKVNENKCPTDDPDDRVGQDDVSHGQDDVSHGQEDVPHGQDDVSHGQDDVSHNADYKENSRTESDQEDIL